jgi:hypothetical protein
MVRFPDESAMSAFLRQWEEDYGDYGATLWTAGIKSTESLGNQTSLPIMNPYHANDLIARAKAIGMHGQ